MPAFPKRPLNLTTMKPPPLTARLNALSDSHKVTQQLIHRLSKLGGSPQPGSKYPDGADEVRVELGAEIHESLKQQEEDLELLRQEAEELTGSQYNAGRRRNSEKDRERARLAAQVARLGEDLRQ